MENSICFVVFIFESFPKQIRCEMKNKINLAYQHPPLQMPYSYGNTIHEHAKRINFLPGVDGVDDVVVHLLVLAHLVDELDEQDKS